MELSPVSPGDDVEIKNIQRFVQVSDNRKRNYLTSSSLYVSTWLLPLIVLINMHNIAH